MAKKAIDIHNDFASCLAFENCILWDAYSPRQFPLFKEKLNVLYRNDRSFSLERNKAMERIRTNIYKSTIAQAKYTNKNLLSTFILITVADCYTAIETRDATKFSVHLVVRTRKCMRNDNSSNCCMIFIDEEGRVYQNWKSFIQDNVLPEGLAFAPSNGCYNYKDGKLCMEAWWTSASRLDGKVKKTMDNVAGLGAFTAAGISIAALAMPVAAPLVAAAGFLGYTTGCYTAIRSIWQLKERQRHEQSIAITDRQARACWLGITTGALAVTSKVTNKALTKIAVTGREISLAEQTAIRGINITSLFLSGSGVANGVVDILMKLSDDEEISTDDWLQMASSLFLFTHSINNIRMASSIKSKASNSKASTLKRTLVTSLKQNYGEIKKTSDRKTDLIRLASEIPDVIDKAAKYIFLANNIYKFVMNRDNLNSCIQIMFKELGEKTAMYITEKANEFMERFKSRVERFIKTTLFYETALHDLYNKCVQNVQNITIQNLDTNINKIFYLLLEHYKQMSCQNPKADVFSCEHCNGFYSLCSV